VIKMRLHNTYQLHIHADMIIIENKPQKMQKWERCSKIASEKQQDDLGVYDDDAT
jgi:hypothetical protein